MDASDIVEGNHGRKKTKDVHTRVQGRGRATGAHERQEHPAARQGTRSWVAGIRAWVKQAEIDEKRDPHGPMTTDEKAEVARLRRELKTVTMERDFLRKAAAFFARSGK